MSNHPPCTAWAEKLVLRYEDLSPADRVALDAHVKTCPVCEAAQADYHFLDARLQALPLSSMKPLPRLSPRDQGKSKEADAGRLKEPVRRFSSTGQQAAHRSSFSSLFQEALPRVLVACLVLGLLLLFGSRFINTSAAHPLGTTLFTYERHNDFVDAVTWSPNGRYIASGS